MHELDWDKAQNEDIVPAEYNATSFMVPPDLPMILKEFYEMCPKFRRNDNASTTPWRKFLSSSQHERMCLRVSPHIVVQARSLVNVFVVEEVKTAIKEGVKSLWEWTIEAARKIVEIPEHIVADPTVHAPLHWECVEKVFTSVQAWFKITRGPSEPTEKKADNGGVGHQAHAELVSLEQKDAETAQVAREPSEILEWASPPTRDPEGKNGDDGTNLYEHVGETLSGIAVSIAFTKSLDLMKKFVFPLSATSKRLLTETLNRLLPPGSLWEGGSDEIKKSLTVVSGLMRDSDAVPSAKLIAACENVSTLCMAWRLDGQGGIECADILTDDGNGGHHGVGLDHLMSHCGYQELLANTTDEMKMKLEEDDQVDLSMESLYRSQDTEFSSNVDAFLITTCAVIGSYFKITRILDIFSNVKANDTHRFLAGVDEWAKTGGYRAIENFDPSTHERNQEGFPKVKKGTRIMEITQLTDFLRRVVDLGKGNNLCRLYTRVKYRVGNAAASNDPEVVYQLLQNIKEATMANDVLGAQYQLIDSIFQGKTFNDIRNEKQVPIVKLENIKKTLRMISLSIGYSKNGVTWESKTTKQKK